MPDMNIIGNVLCGHMLDTLCHFTLSLLPYSENVLCGHMLDALCHFTLSLLPYSENESYAFKFNLKLFSSQ
jgi:hypothetical protein